MIRVSTKSGSILLLVVFLAGPGRADPCGMVPPIHLTGVVPIERIGLQKTYVFFRDGVETFVIRPGYRGRVEHFGMLIPFPTPPAIRKVPDDIFAHLAAAVDPPEVIVDLRPVPASVRTLGAVDRFRDEKKLEFDAVRVLRQEAVGMYEVAVLEAGSAQALKRWMDDHGYRYPEGMDDACEDYVDLGWCFVAVKTRIGNKAAVDPKPGLREVDPKLPPGASFDGNVQAMGFRFPVSKLVVPMRLSAFNAGELRNVVYVLTDGPRKIVHMPESFVVRQIPGEDLYRHVTAPLPLRVIGGSYDEIPEFRRNRLKAERDPAPHNGHARDLFASDLLAARTRQLSHAFEEKEKELLKISERLGLRGAEIDARHAAALADERERTLSASLEGLRDMTLTVVDGDFPRDLLSRENLTFSTFAMPAGKNQPELYDAKQSGPAPSPREGKVYRTGSLIPFAGSPLVGWALVGLIGAVFVTRRWFGRHRLPGGSAGASRTTLLAVLSLTLPGWLGWIALSATPTSVAEDRSVTDLITRLDDPEHAEEAAAALVALGDSAVVPLYAEAIEGQHLARRGWAVACLAEIGGANIDRRLIAIHDDDRQPPLLRTWAAAARVKLARGASELVELAHLVSEFPSLRRPIGLRLPELLGRGKPASAADLIRLSLRVPELQSTVAGPLFALGPASLVEALCKSEDQNVRQQAAAYLASLAGQSGDRKSEVARAVVQGYRFDPSARNVPWQGGPLFVPGIAWPQSEARQLSGELLRWFLFCERKGLRDEQRQLHNNLRSLGLARAAGYQSPGWREVGLDEWLRTWLKAFGRDPVLRILQEQGVAEEPRYAQLLGDR